ncbi:MAG: HlyD family efflux transporter periplasmic adaptor subunit, partial [Okeania sp. SIO3B3]|nr:HlyD family efflux transporter periplasmic adaptor subunit [Okeania sp. SIO3B3]
PSYNSIFSQKIKPKEDKFDPSSPFLLVNKKQELEEYEQDNEDDNDDDYDYENYDLKPINFITILGGIFIIGAFGVAATLASVIKYPVSVQAEAQIRPQGKLKIVQSSAEGRIKEILVKENQYIQTEDKIAILEDDRLQIQKSQLQNKIEQFQAELKQIKSKLDRHKIALEIENIKNERTIDTLEAELDEIIRNHQEKSITVETQVEEAHADLISAQEELQRAELELQSAEAELKFSEVALEAAIEKRDVYEEISAEGVISEQRYKETKLAFKQAEQDYNVRQSRLKVREKIIEQRKQNINATKARLTRLKAHLNPTKAPIKAQEHKIEREVARGKTTLITLKKEEDELKQEIIRIKQQINHTKKELQQIENLLGQTIIRSPLSGTLFNLSLRNISQNVRIGDEIAQIAPNDASLAIKGFVRNADISKVKIGQKVQMKISACPYPDYGTLKGQVLKISPDAISPNSKLTSSTSKVSTGEKYYEITIRPSSNSFGHKEKICDLQLGMEGKADIISREETVMKFILRKARLITDL